MRVGAFEIPEPVPELKEPHVLAVLQPWIDVGNVGTLVLSRLEAQWNAAELGRLVRPGTFFDFTRYRPVLDLKEGRRELAIPNAIVSYGRSETGRDFLLLRLLEPARRRRPTWIRSWSFSRGSARRVTVSWARCMTGAPYPAAAGQRFRQQPEAAERDGNRQRAAQ